MKDYFAFAGGILMLFCTVPYVIDIVKGKTKPNVITWFIWTVLIAIAAAALLASGQRNAALLLIGDMIATFVVVLFGLRYGIAKLDRFDIWCLLGALLGLLLWWVYNSPLVAIYATLLIDLIGTIPTVRHSWKSPEEETAVTFFIGAVAALLTVVSLHSYSLIALVYPAYLLLSNIVLYITIKHGQRYTKNMV